MKKIIVTLVLASLCNVTKGQNCALRFDALGQYADLQDLNNDYNILEFWIKIHEDGYSGAILSGDQNAVHLAKSSNGGRYSVSFRPNRMWEPDIPPIQSGIWHKIRITKLENSIKLYVYVPSLGNRPAMEEEREIEVSELISFNNSQIFVHNNGNVSGFDIDNIKMKRNDREIANFGFCNYPSANNIPNEINPTEYIYLLGENRNNRPMIVYINDDLLAIDDCNLCSYILPTWYAAAPNLMFEIQNNGESIKKLDGGVNHNFIFNSGNILTSKKEGSMSYTIDSTRQIIYIGLNNSYPSGSLAEIPFSFLLQQGVNGKMQLNIIENGALVDKKATVYAGDVITISRVMNSPFNGKILWFINNIEIHKSSNPQLECLFPEVGIYSNSGVLNGVQLSKEWSSDVFEVPCNR